MECVRVGCCAAVVLACALLAVCVGAQPSPVPPVSPVRIGFQVHSWDDVREWPAMLRKGVRWLKIDPHFMDAAWCAAALNDTDPRGCLPLRHDEPVVGPRYDTIDSVLTFIADPKLRDTFTDAADPFVIALCFKTDFDPCNSSSDGARACACIRVSNSGVDGAVDAANFLSLTDDLVRAVNETTTAHALSVQWVIDGSGTAGGLPKARTCLSERWRPLPFTYIPARDPIDAFTSSDPARGYDRFSVLDVPSAVASVWDVVTTMRFGKFSSLPAPYLLWEPSDQDEILERAGRYLARGGPAHAAGMRFAINIDPAMFHVYSARASQLYWNANVFDWAANRTASGPRVAAVVAAGAPAGSDARWMCVAANETAAAASPLAVRCYPAPSGGVSAPLDGGASRTTVFPGGTVLAATSTLLSLLDIGDSRVVAYGSAGETSVLRVNADGSVSRVFTSMLPVVGTSVAQGAAALPTGGTGGDAVVVLRAQWLSAGGDGHVLLDAWLVDGSDDAVEYGETTLPGWNAGELGDEGAQSLQLSAVWCTDDDAATGFCNVSECRGGSEALVALTAGGIDGTTGERRVVLQVVAVCVTSAQGVLSARALSPVSTYAPGTWPSVSLLRHAGALLLAETHGDGWCPNCETVNKRPTPALCDSVPASLDGVLSYTWGTLADWCQQLMSKTPVSVCDERFVHGAFSQGSLPSVALFTVKGVLGMAAAHVGAAPGVPVTPECGLPSASSGVLLDSWGVYA